MPHKGRARGNLSRNIEIKRKQLFKNNTCSYTRNVIQEHQIYPEEDNRSLTSIVSIIWDFWSRSIISWRHQRYSSAHIIPTPHAVEMNVHMSWRNNAQERMVISIKMPNLWRASWYCDDPSEFSEVSPCNVLSSNFLSSESHVTYSIYYEHSSDLKESSNVYLSFSVWAICFHAAWNQFCWVMVVDMNLICLS